ncbi:MAG: Hsp70 family protein [Polyangiaceae bacterium]|nr:Hsp70 family protein [Polyangiaceae bacterium]
MSARHTVGVDLGTTHTALAWARPEAEGATPEVLAIPQLVGPGQLEVRPLLPSFLWLPEASEGPQPLPWDPGRRHVVGELARARASEAPGRVVASAKSWLSHSGIDRRAPALPAGAPEGVERVSPVEASFRYLDHLVEAWAAAFPTEAPLGEQDVLLTVPASFDAVARELTVEAAYAASLDSVSLLEEPQAALYAWLGATPRWRELLAPGDVVLVLDVGGGTTDFSAIQVRDRGGELELHRVAVGDHILLGGDNMDLALAELARRKLAAAGHALDRAEVAGLVFGVRAAKERLLGPSPPERVPLAVASRGARLVGATRRTELTLDEVRGSLVDGFFPVTDASARPAQRARSGLLQVGLPYAQDAAVTRHLAAFLARQAGATGAGRSLLHPTHVLFNGGVVKAAALRERLVSVLDSWLVADGGRPVRVLPNADPDLAVARGAAWYGLARAGRGLRIRGGTARAHYVGIESPAPAVPGLEPPTVALCVAPFGMEEGTRADLPPLELAVVVGSPVRFRFFGSSLRRGDQAGELVEEPAIDALEELAPLELTLPAEGRDEGEIVPVALAASLTAVGTLLLEAVPLAPRVEGERWKIELGVREAGASG